MDIARNLAAGRGFRVTPDTAETMMRGPGFPYVLSGLIRLFGDSVAAVRVANGVFSIGTMAMVVILARRVVRSPTAVLLAVLITGLWPQAIFLESRINVESIFTFLLVLFVLLLHIAVTDGRKRLFLVAGIALGLTTLTRSSPVFAIPVIFCYLILPWGPRLAVRAALARTILLGLGALMVLTPWMARNYLLVGVPSFSESLAGMAAYEGWYVTKTMEQDKPYFVAVGEAWHMQRLLAAANGIQTQPAPRPNDSRYDLFRSTADELRYNALLRDAAIEEYLHDPMLLVKHCVTNALRFWFQGTWPTYTFLNTLTQVPLLLLAAAGGYLSWRRGLVFGPLFVVIATIWIVHTPLISHARFSIPLVPFLGILASLPLSLIAQGLRRGYFTASTAAQPLAFSPEEVSRSTGEK